MDFCHGDVTKCESMIVIGQWLKGEGKYDTNIIDIMNHFNHLLTTHDAQFEDIYESLRIWIFIIYKED